MLLLFLGLVYLAAWSGTNRAGPPSPSSPPVTGPVTPSPADGGSFADPFAVFDAFAAGPGCEPIAGRYAFDDRPESPEVNSAHCSDSSGELLLVDVYDTQAVRDEQVRLLAVRLAGEDGTSLGLVGIVGVNWSLWGDASWVAAVRPWVGGQPLVLT